MSKTAGMAEREGVIARELGLTIAHVHNAVRRLREAGHIESGRPVAPPLTSRDLARMILGQCAQLPVNAPEIESKIGALPRISGDGATTAETELTDILDGAAGRVPPQIDYTTGDVLVSSDGDFMLVSGECLDGMAFNRTYRRDVAERGLRRIVQIQLRTLRRIAQQLL